MKTRITELSKWLALFAVISWFVLPAGVQAELGTAASTATQLGTGVLVRGQSMESATATLVKGHVFKALPTCQNKMMLGNQTPCKQYDLLPDGSVVQTGKETDSYAELQWGNGKIARIWKHSLVRVFCGRSARLDTVCLARGSLSFRKDHTDPNYYYVETKLLQARIHGTTVDVHILPGRDEFKVLEGGKVQVKDNQTGVFHELDQGETLVVRAKASYKCKDRRFQIPF